MENVGIAVALVGIHWRPIFTGSACVCKQDSSIQLCSVVEQLHDVMSTFNIPRVILPHTHHHPLEGQDGESFFIALGNILWLQCKSTPEQFRGAVLSAKRVVRLWMFIFCKLLQPFL